MGEVLRRALLGAQVPLRAPFYALLRERAFLDSLGFTSEKLYYMRGTTDFFFPEKED